jgi:PBP1b-binding outer membrane lipoprotein LpoB
MRGDEMNWRQRATFVAVIALAVTSMGGAQEKKIDRRDLPAAVEKTVAEQAKGATIRGFSTEMENGKRLYEVQLIVNGHSKDISMDASGNVLEIEEEVAMESLSAGVKEALVKSAGTGTITRVESITKNGKLVAYEAVVKTGSKRSEIQVGPDGNKLAHPE